MGTYEQYSFFNSENENKFEKDNLNIDYVKNCFNEEYRRMQADMFNLYPAIGEVNGRRSNYSMGIIEGEKREFGKCDVEIKSRKVEPREEFRGEIARTYMYMDSVYPGRGIISKKNWKLFESWHRSDPVDEWECERAKRIEKIQGNRNEIVLKKC